jgi:hypothetical protein
MLGESPAASLIKVIDEKPVAKIEDRTLIMAEVGPGVFAASCRIRPLPFDHVRLEQRRPRQASEKP